MDNQTYENTNGSIVGTDKNDTLVGTEGNDTIIGNLGDDLKIGAGGDDLFIWNNGDGSDIIEGDDGHDVVQVNGAVDAGNDFELRANGERAEFERLNLGNFTLSVDGVEQFEINGGSGDDTLNVKDLTGTDVQQVIFNGGDGNDYFDASQASIDTVAIGGAGSDTLIGGAGNDLLLGGGGNDITDGGAGNDTADFSDIGAGIVADLKSGYAQYIVNDTVVEDSLISIENLNGSAFNDDFTGNDEANVFQGGDGVDTLKGLGGNDTIIGDLGDDLKVGGAGDDLFIWNNGDGSDIIEGDDGYDVVQVNGAVDAGNDFELRANHGRAEFERLNLGNFTLNVDNVEQFEINGGSGDDTLNVKDLTGTDVEQVIFNGGDGNDYFDASAASVATVAQGGAGSDTLIGGAGNDLLIGGGGSDITDGGAGNDTADFSDIGAGIVANLESGYAQYIINDTVVEDSLISIENLNGSAFNDDFTGNDEANVFQGGDGVDTLKGLGGNDTIIGDLGDDLKIGGAGDDRFIWNNGDGSDIIEGDDGYDVVQVNGAVDAGNDFELRANGERAEFERLNLGNFTLNVDNVEQFEINGGSGDDILNVKDLTGTDVQQVIFNGGAGNDYFDASYTSVDVIAFGEAGDDSLTGGSGNDIINGGDGNDILIGGVGADTFVLGFDGIDTIVDFNFAEGDRIQLSTLELGISSADALSYDSSTQALSFGEVEFARLESPSAEFNPTESIDWV